MQGFIRISKYAGMRNDLGQAGGGNTSVKLDDQVMLVKSSGFQLADLLISRASTIASSGISR